MFDFQEQLRCGSVGERYVLSRHAGYTSAPKGERRYDLLTDEGRTVEVKHDTHCMDATLNMFMERWTTPQGRPRYDGGPWRALKHGVDVFVYMYSNGQDLDGHHDPALLPVTAFWFYDVPALVARLDELVAAKRCPTRRVANLGLFALGYLVRRKLVADLGTEVEYR